jgi:hypothetical protein
MKTTLGKVLSVATAIASVIFMGFVLVATMGGPNWEAEAHSIEGFTFSKTDTAPVKWTATKHVGQANFTPNDALEPVIVAAYDASKQEAQAKLDVLKAKDGPLQAAIDAAQASINTDVKALTDQIDELDKLLDQTEAEVLATAQQVDAKAEEVRKVEVQIQSRREDVLRLMAQVEEIRADRYRIHEIQQQLQDLIQQIDGSLDRAERRREQLKTGI